MAEVKTDQNNTPKKLYRSQSNRAIAGIAGGLSEYFNIDILVVRILFILSVFIGGMGVPAYLIAWVIIPNENIEGEPDKKERSNQSMLIWGALFIILGLIILGRQFYWWDYDNFYYNWHWHPWSFFGMDFGFLIPVVLIAAGAYYIIKTRKDGEAGEPSKQISGEKNMEKKLTRTVDEKMVAGVCGGLAKYLNVDVSIVRIAFAVLTIGSGFFTGVIVYIAMIFIVPEEGTDDSSSPTVQKESATKTSPAKSTTAKKTSSKSSTTKSKAKSKMPSKTKKDDSEQGS